MKLFKTMALASTFALSLSVYAQTETAPTKGADKDAVNAACKADGDTAGCGAEQVGGGLLKCIHAYKKAHKEFKISDACKAATKQLKTDRKKK